MFLNPNRPASVLFLTDAYKLDHRRQYPEGTQRVYSNFTSRGSRVDDIHHTVHFGLQAFIRSYLMDGFKAFFAAEEDAVAEDYQLGLDEILGPNDIGTDHVRALHRLGYLPLRFYALPEGTLVPLKVPSFTFENTHDDFFWVTNYIETVLSSAIWQASTSATTAWYMRRILDHGAQRTGMSTDLVNFQGHDFSFRGMSGVDAAAASGAGHLISFTGTDSLVSLDWIKYYYKGSESGFLAGSVPATEHSVMCAGGKETELETFRRLLFLYQTGFLSIVSDTWDFWAVLTKILPELKEEIMNRDGRVVIRPDSGDPVDIICGTVTATGLLPGGTPQQKGAIEVLWDLFGGTVNDAGFRVLDPHIGLIYGDSINPERARLINNRLAAKGFATTNWVAGVGSFTYQYVTRDTFMSAIKATWALINDEEHYLQKQPATDNGTKKSATGRLAVVWDENYMRLIERATPKDEARSLLRPIWQDGEFLVEESFADVRQNLKSTTDMLLRIGAI